MDQTPTGIVSKVIATPDGKISVSFGVITPDTRYHDCGVILLPPGDSGADSSAQAKLWMVGQGTGFDYNSSIHLAISPPDSHEPVGTTGINDSLIINGSSNKIPEGKWMLYLVSISTTGTIASATWHINETHLTNQSLAFSFAEHQSDAMKEYGFYQGPGFWASGYFWMGVFIFSLMVSFALAIALVVVAVREKRH
jgi:hypothetical protein